MVTAAKYVNFLFFFWYLIYLISGWLGRIFGCGVCFDAPSHIVPYVCLERIVNKTHIVNIFCRLQLKYIVLNYQNSEKQTIKKF